MADPAPNSAATRPRTPPVRNIVLEGGGGKGFAYLGLVRALEGLPPPGQGGRAIPPLRNYLKDIENFAGSSAGAITSMFLALKYDSEDVRQIMAAEAESFKRFMSPTNPDAERGDLATALSDGPIEKYLKYLSTVESAMPQFQTFLQLIGKPEFQVGPMARNLATDWGVFGGDRKLQLVKQVSGSAPMPMAHMDLAPPGMPQPDGDAALLWLKRQVLVGLQRLLPKGSALKTPDPYGATFSQLLATTGKRLFVTGTNLSTGRTMVFSNERTPEFPVAVAVRISMSIPIAFSPIALSNEFLSMRGIDPDFAGVYVDGGLWNNTPFQILNKDAAEGLLIARLEKSARTEITSFSAYMKSISGAVLAAGESQIEFANADQIIEIETGELSMLNFSPDPAIADPVVESAYYKTLEWLRDRENAARPSAPASAATRPRTP